MLGMTNTRPTLTAEAAREILDNRYASAGRPVDHTADAEALATLAADPVLGAALFGLAAAHSPLNLLPFRVFMIEVARARGLEAGRWRSYADNIGPALARFRPF